MPPTIRTTFDANGNLTAIETYQGPRGWVQLLAEPIQRADVPDLATAIVKRPTPDEARSVGKVADHLRQLATEVDPPRMADGFEADRMRLLAHRLRDVAAMLPDADEARRLVEAHRIAVTAHAQAVALIPDSATAADRSGEATARTALLRALGVEA